ncbi:MAG: designed protein CTPR3 [Candidatus Peregrinibacteria bacterium Greene0416_19]|nr:MAG: designed protein CTPR3 [Candidatus Peregrinibacteria bacterium Greene0416_19]
MPRRSDMNKDPDRVMELTQQAIALSDEGHYDAAEALLRKALVLLPDNEDIIRNYVNFCIEVAHNHHCVFENFVDAIKYYKKVLEVVPTEAETWMDLGSAHASNQEIMDALQAWQKALELLDVTRPRDKENIRLILENVRMVQGGLKDIDGVTEE